MKQSVIVVGQYFDLSWAYNDINMNNISIAWILFFAFWQLIYEIIETSLSCTFLFQVTFDIFFHAKSSVGNT